MRKALFTISFFLFTNLVFGQETGKNSKPPQVLTRELSEIPTFPGCKKHSNWIEKEFCLTNSVQELIANKAKSENLTLQNDTLKIRMRIEVDGLTTVMENKSSNKKLEEISQSILAGLPNIEPSFSKRLNSKVTSAYSFFVIFIDNELKSLWKKNK